MNFDLVENLNLKEDCQVDELCCHHSVHNEPLPEPSGYRLFRAPLFTIKFSTPISFRFFDIYRRIRNNYDIIHWHLPNPVATMAALIFPTRAKVVLHWHSDIVKQKKLRKIYKPLQTMLLRRADRIILTGRLIYSLIKRRSVSFQSEWIWNIWLSPKEQINGFKLHILGKKLS